MGNETGRSVVVNDEAGEAIDSIMQKVCLWVLKTEKDGKLSVEHDASMVEECRP